MLGEAVGLLLLCALKLEATSVSDFCCPKRNLFVTVDNILRLYIDGDEITALPNANFFNRPDVVDLPCTTRLIAIFGRNENTVGLQGILASTADDYVLTNSTWKCSNNNHSGWEGIDFDDSAWMPAMELGSNGVYEKFISGFSSNASWIWLTDRTAQDVYCRKQLGYDCCCYATNGGKNCKVSTGNYRTAAIILGVFLGVAVLANIALISAIWVPRLRRKAVQNDGKEEHEAENKDEGQSDVHVRYQAHLKDPHYQEDNGVHYAYPD